MNQPSGIIAVVVAASVVVVVVVVAASVVVVVASVVVVVVGVVAAVVVVVSITKIKRKQRIENLDSRPKAIHFSWLGPELSSVAWPTGAQLMNFFCFRFPVVLFGRPGISICHTTCCFC